ncbi:MAG: peptidoglycan-binding protein [Firmicutes bacterium HGW-Firmicutes-7]|nr:MAG: peptidoglycan-binding protein [Firmicutes bacterium HGW-Firmicutes-7]
MSNYAVFFDYDDKTYRLPTNPEQLEITSTQAIQKYEVLKSGQIAVPVHMELKQYSFECEFPSKAHIYVETAGDFKAADYYLTLFEKWRNELTSVGFIAHNGVEDDIVTEVLIESLTITEKAGEEGDKYISFKLLEYKKYDKQFNVVTVNSGDEALATKLVIPTSTITNPKNTGYYVVKSGDSLWAIAKKYYGDGSKYSKIYNANKSIIKNANLIYPGQKLTIPS